MKVFAWTGLLAWALTASAVSAQPAAPDEPSPEPPDPEPSLPVQVDGVAAPVPASEASADLAQNDPSGRPPPVVDSGAGEAGRVEAQTTRESEARLEPVQQSARREDHGGYRGPFAKGRVRISVVVGGGSTAIDDYMILGAGLGYFVFDGFEASLDAQAWIFGDPFIMTLTPGARYVFYQVPYVNPYLGAFFRAYFIEDRDDFTSWGARAGISIPVHETSYIGGGIVYERLFDCDQGDFGTDCDQFYPEVAFSISF